MARLQQLSTFYADESPGIRISPVRSVLQCSCSQLLNMAAHM